MKVKKIKSKSTNRMHCFNCEIDMPVKVDKKGIERCDNCGRSCYSINNISKGY